ncbi:MAG TPA: hypothetical protein VE781_04130 [Kineosporiaceae bacterium]|jgi:hypothetical protein|nr:hypothetical protein [Kineosporiaceae bacterium]
MGTSGDDTREGPRGLDKPERRWRIVGVCLVVAAVGQVLVAVDRWLSSGPADGAQSAVLALLFLTLGVYWLRRAR